MATIIKSISLHNFYNYYGSYDNNTYNFSEGLNFVNADNNGGKTKLFCALLWLFKDETYNQDLQSRVKVSSNEFILMLSRKADRENAGQRVSMGVRIIFEDSQHVQYTLVKQVQFEPNRNNQRVSFRGKKTTNFGNDIILESDDERNQALQLLIPKPLINYALLQGEYMDRILDVTSSKEFANTIRSLSGIREIESLTQQAEKCRNNANDLLKEEEGKASLRNNEIAELIKRQHGLKANIDRLQSDIDLCIANRANAIDHRDNLEAFISSAEERTKLRNEFKEVEKTLASKQKELNNFELKITEGLFSNYNPWVLYGLSSEKADFREMRDQHFMNVKRAQGLGGILLPDDSPDQPSLRRMLETRICEVCGRSFKEHSQEWDHISALLNRGENPQATRNDFLGFIDQIRSVVECVGTDEQGIEDGIAGAKSEYLSLKEDIKNLNNRKENILVQLVNAGGSEKPNQHEDDADIAKLKEYAKALKDISDNENSIRTKKPELDRRRAEYEEVKRRIESSPDVEDTKPYRDFDSDTQAIYDILVEVRENIYNDIITSIEESSNNYFSLLTQNNAVRGGVIRISKLDDKNIQVTVMSVDEQDEMAGLGTGFQRMKQLAILMAIIQTQIGGTKYDSPLVADAPFSGFGSNFMYNFMEQTPKVFKQVIILTKDTVNTLDNGTVVLRRLGEEIKNRIVNGEIQGTFYLNQPSCVEDQTKLETKIRQFN